MKRVRLFLATLILLVGLGGVVPIMASAVSPQQTVCTTLGSDAKCSQTPSGSVSLNNVLKAIINTLSLVIGVTAVIMIIVSGSKYITASGDSNKVTSAKNTLIYAVVGLAVVALAQFIVKFVLAKLK